MDLNNVKMTRKEFLKKAGLLCLGVGLSSAIGEMLLKRETAAEGTGLHEAMFYRPIDSTTVQCELCARRCTLSNGTRSFCRAREPRGGKLYSMVYGKACAVHVDPIEKKPLFHFLPGTPVFSIATAGCNYRCKYCQNWQISQVTPEETFNYDLSPDEVVSQAMKRNCPTIAYTYTEPSIFYEYMLDTAKAARMKGIANMYHSNGSLAAAPAQELSRHLDAADIDLKGWTQDFYTDVCAGQLDTVLETLKILKKNGVWVEVTNLVVPTLNDDPAKIKDMTAWIRQNLGADTPVHFSRFWPQYKLENLYPTPIETLEKARQAAVSSGLNYVYIGNVAGHQAENTYCPGCKKPVMRRSGYTILSNDVVGGKCRFCGREIAGVWS